MATDGPAIVWCVPVAGTMAALDAPEHRISTLERRRAARYADAATAARFIAARAALRHLLAERLDCHPLAVVVEADAAGRPQLGGSGLRFSVSHSGDLALIALADAGRLGVDIEALRPVPDALAIARKSLDGRVAAALAGLPEPARSRRFLAAWTALEARLKAQGWGLDRIDQLPEGDGLRLTPLDLPAGHVGALASDAAGAPHLQTLAPDWLWRSRPAARSVRPVAAARAEFAS